MLYALLNSNNITRVGLLHELWPDVGFPADGPSEDWLTANSAKKVLSYKQHIPDFQIQVNCEPYIEEDKVYNVRVEPASAEHIENMKLSAWSNIRATRDKRMASFEWRYNRYYREQRLGVNTTDSLADLDAYMQALADITEQTDPYNIIWPEYE